MKIFNFGLPRTGTSSFHQFLLNNKIKSIHTNDGLIKYIYPEEYNKFKKDEKSILDYIIYKNDAFGDLPWYSLYEEIIKKHNNALFFVTTRDAKHWAASIKKIQKHMFAYDEMSNYHLEFFKGLIQKNTIADEKKLINFFNENNEKILYCSKKYNVEINFLNLDDIDCLLNTLKNKIKIFNLRYPNPKNIIFI